MEVVRGGRVGLHSELRRYIPNGDNGFDDAKLFLPTGRPAFVERKDLLKELQNGHSPIAVAVAFHIEIDERKRYQLERARDLHGTPDETPVWKKYYLKHLAEIQGLN